MYYNLKCAGAQLVYDGHVIVYMCMYITMVSADPYNIYVIRAVVLVHVWRLGIVIRKIYQASDEQLHIDFHHEF